MGKAVKIQLGRLRELVIQMSTPAPECNYELVIQSR
jgi:hypothetical protein